MKVVRSLDEVGKDSSSVVTVGTFDGVHLAHQEIIREVVNRARMNEGRSVVVTFEPHPKEVVGRKDQPVHLLTTLEERIELIGLANIDLLLVIDFTYDFSRLSAREFYQRYVVEGIGVSEVVVGYDHMFGRDRTGGIDELVHMGREFNFSVSAVHPISVDGEIVSSTRVRRAIDAGDIEHAARLLGHPFELEGDVVKGDGRGRTLGYPTANIHLRSPRKIVPGHGIYFVGVVLRGKQWYGMMSVGVRPTIKDGGERTIEVHVFGLNDDVYGEELQVTFLRRLRDELKFASVGELVTQMHKDKETSLRFLAELEKRK